jgi:hypothetical protein
MTSRSPCSHGPHRETPDLDTKPPGTQALIHTFPPENSPFIIGLTSHPDLEPTQMPRLLEAVGSFLLEIRQHLPDTQIRVMLDARTDVIQSISRAVLALDIAVEAYESPTAILADMLMRRASLLLALWDGKSSSAPDDAAGHVFRFLGVHGAPGETLNRIETSTIVNDLDVAARLVFWVPVRRLAHDASDVVGQAGYLLPAGDDALEVQPSMPPSLKRRLADLNEYNCEFERLTADGKLARGESLIRDKAAVAAASDAAVLENIDRQFVKADALARYMQLRSDRLFNVFGVTAVTMGLPYLIYDNITESKILLILYTLVLLISLLLFYFFQTKRWFGKYLAYRALAETLRVRFYLALAGVDRRLHAREVIALSGVYRFPGFGWISFALDSIEPGVLEASEASGHDELRARLVDQAWIEDQYRYFESKVATMERRRYWIGRLKTGVFVAVLIVLSVMFMFGAALHHVDSRTGLPLKNVLTFFSGSLAVVLGVWEVRHNKMAVQELLWQYRNQLIQFQRARIQLKRTTTRARRRAILEELAANSLMEIYLWAIHRYHREHAPPSAP